MCLTKTHKEIKTADKDIPVYKVLTEDNFAPYQDFYRYHRGLNTPVDLPPSLSYHADIVDNGYLHAYTSALVAKRTAESLQVRELFRRVTVPDWRIRHEGHGRRKFKVVEMVVPKGEAYWLGDMNDIAATRLEWKEEPEATRKIFRLARQ